MRSFFVFLTLFSIITIFSCSDENLENIKDVYSGGDNHIIDIYQDTLLDTFYDVKPDTEYTEDTGSCNIQCPKNMHCEKDKCICNEGFADCNYDLSDGCEADINNDVNNCGSCTISCASPKLGAARYVCIKGFCEVIECLSGRADCDKEGNNGCEVYLNDDNKNCGFCGFDCGQNSKCIDAKCDCQNGFANCNLLLDDGCEINTTVDSDNCGTCKNKCGNNGFCNGGKCDCIQYYGNCNNSWTDGCETYVKDNIKKCGDCSTDCTKLPNVSKSTCNTDVCTILACNSGFDDCDNNFINGCEANLTNDSANCGSCNNNCGQNTVCENRECKCKKGFADCNNNFRDGCETKIDSDDNNCGACGYACGYASSCTNSMCVCYQGHADCNNNQKDGCEAFLLNNNSNCGKCLNNCGTSGYCDNGDCKSCISSFANCNMDYSDRCEIDLATDSKNCGNCNNKCNQNAYCNQMKCMCTTNYWNCNNDWGDGCEINLSNDDNNCGSCNFKCNFMAYCEQSVCKCYPNYGNCNSNWGDGCETELRKSNEHCGSCGNACNDNALCNSGMCTCYIGYANCNSDWTDGCEVNLMSDQNNCGMCSKRCNIATRSFGKCISGNCSGTLLWGKSFGGNMDDKPCCISIDSLENIILAGTFSSSTINFGGQDLSIGNTLYNSYIAKFDNKGEHLWSQSIDGQITTSGNFSNGDIIIGGIYSDTTYIGGNKLTSKGGYDIFIAKFSMTGGFNWVKSFGGNSDDYLEKLVINRNNEVIITGNYSSSLINFGGTDLTGDLYLAKFSNNGDHIWSKSFNNATAKDLTTFSSQIVMAGEFTGITNFGCENLSSKGMQDVFAFVFSSDGNCINGLSFGGTDNEFLNSIYIDSQLNTILTGSFLSTIIDFGSNQKITNKGMLDIYVAKFMVNGVFQWAKSFGGSLDDAGKYIKTDSENNIILTGFYNSNSINFDGGDHLNNGMADGFILKLSQNGDFIFSKSFGLLEFDSGTAVDILSSTGDIIFTGSFSSSKATIDEMTFNNKNQSGMATADILLLKFGK